MEATAEPIRELVRLRGRSYVAFVFCPVVPIAGWLEDIDATWRARLASLTGGRWCSIYLPSTSALRRSRISSPISSNATSGFSVLRALMRGASPPACRRSCRGPQLRDQAN